MFSWDVLALTATVLLGPALIPTVRNPQAFVPRSTSLLTFVGLTVLVLPMIASGLILTGLAIGVNASAWGFILLFRGGHDV